MSASTMMILNTTTKMAWRRGPRQFGWVALGLLGSSVPTALALCEEGDDKPSILDTIFPKNQDGNVSWDKAGRQVGDQLFWDNLAKATGAKVRRCYFYSSIFGDYYENCFLLFLCLFDASPWTHFNVCFSCTIGFILGVRF